MSAHTVCRLSRLLAGCRERAYADEWDGWDDQATAALERRVLELADRSGDLAEIIQRANELTERGQLALVWARS